MTALPVKASRCWARPRAPSPCESLLNWAIQSAFREIAEGKAVVKFGVPIGIAKQSIHPGDWVHLHNCASRLDERSGAFDVHTGVPRTSL